MPEAPVARRARAEFLEWLRSAGARGAVFLQVRVLPASGGGYELRHLADADLPRESLQPHQGTRAALDLARSTAAGGHRPLRTASDLRRGWMLTGLDADGVWDALSLLYPAAGTHWYRGRAGELDVVPWDRAAARQTGIYADVARLSGTPLDHAVRACCGDGLCLRVNSWHPADRSTGTAADGTAPSAGVPCPEACSLFVSFAREIVHGIDPWLAAVHFALSADDGKALATVLRRAADYLASGDVARVGIAEFDRSLNPRRLRYVAGRVEDDVRPAPPGDETGPAALDFAWTGDAAAGPEAVRVAEAVCAAVDAAGALAEHGTPAERVSVRVHPEKGAAIVLRCRLRSKPAEGPARAVEEALRPYREEAGGARGWKVEIAAPPGA